MARLEAVAAFLEPCIEILFPPSLVVKPVAESFYSDDEAVDCDDFLVDFYIFPNIINYDL